MPIKLKAKLRQTQEIADVILGNDGSTTTRSGQEGGVRVLSDLVSPLRHYVNKRRSSITKIQANVLKERRMATPELHSSDFQSSSDDEERGPSPKLGGHRSKSVLATSGVAGTRSIIKKLIEKKAEE